MSDQQFKKFVTEEEVVETKQRRQAEWERIRQPDDPIECPEEETRSLFEQLKDNKDYKDKEFEDESKLRSSIKGLDDDEAQFLNFVSNRQLQIEKERNKEEKSVIAEMKIASVVKIEDKKSTPTPSSSSSSSSSSGKKTQQELLRGAIKRKSTDTKADGDSKRAREPETGESEMNERGDAKLMSGIPKSNGVAVVAGILPGISGYAENDSSTENTSNSSDSEDDHTILPRTVTQRVIQEMVQKIKDNCG